MQKIQNIPFSIVLQTPRPEAASVLMTLFSFCGIIHKFPSFKDPPDISIEFKVNFILNFYCHCFLSIPNFISYIFLFCWQLRILNILLHAAKREQSGLARCIALSGLGIYLVQEFEKRSEHAKIREAYHTLLLSLKVRKYIKFPLLRTNKIFPNSYIFAPNLVGAGTERSACERVPRSEQTKNTGLFSASWS